MSYLEKAQDIQDKMLKGQLMEAFEQYYHEDVVIIEERFYYNMPG